MKYCQKSIGSNLLTKRTVIAFIVMPETENKVILEITQ